MNSPFFCRNRKARQERVLRKMAAMRAAKARKRMACPREEPEPRLVRFYPFEFGVRVKQTGETVFVDLRSVRHAARALGLILRHFQP